MISRELVEEGLAVPSGKGRGIEWWIGRSQIPSSTFRLGPWKGSRRSVPATEVPLDYAAAGFDNLYLPRSGQWIRRNGQTQRFDTFGASNGLLPAKWGAKGRQLSEFLSESVSDGVPTLIGLATKETIATGVDDGRFSNVYIRDQVNNLNYTLGSEYDGGAVYPALGTYQQYKFVPLWYESGDGGLTRGVDEFTRRFFACGSRRFLKVGNWWYFPNRFGTPCRWRGNFTPQSLAYATVASSPAADIGVGSWTTDLGGNANIYTRINEAIANDANYVSQGAGNLGSIYTIRMGTLAAPPAGAIHTLYVRYKFVVTAGPNDCQFDIQLINPSGVGNIYAPAPIAGPHPTSFTTLVHQLTAGEVAAISSYGTGGVGSANGFQLLLSGGGTATHGYFQVSWVQFTISSPATIAEDRLFPSGPIPPCHAGYLTKGTISGSSVTTNMLPNADKSVGGWLNESGLTPLYPSLADPGNTATYIHAVGGSASADIRLAAPPFTPDGTNYQVSIQQTAQGSGATLAVNLYEIVGGVDTLRSVGAVSGVVNGGWTNYSYTLSAAEVTSVVDWTALFLRFTLTGGGTLFVSVATAYLQIVPITGALIGGWSGSDRFYFAIAYRFEDGSVWMPSTPRAPNARLTNGLNLFTVDSANPTNHYDRIVWTLPIPPYGVKSVTLLRSTKIDSTQQDNLELNPRDLRIVWEVDAGTTSYNDYFADDSALVLDAGNDFIRFDHIMPPRARYIFGGDMRVCVGYGGQNPAAIILCPVGRAADWDLNLADTDPNAYTANGSYMQVAIATDGTGSLTLETADGNATVSHSLALAFGTYATLQDMVDRINATSFAADGLQWRAQIAPGASPDASCLNLAPHSRAVANCVTVNTNAAVTLASGALKLAVGAKVSGTGIPANAYVLHVDSDTQFTLSAPATANGTVTLTFTMAMGDAPTSATAGAGWQRVIANSLPGFLYFSATYLNRVPLEKDAVWMTSAIPGATKSAPNNFNGSAACRHKPPLDSGIVMGGAGVDNGFVVPYSQRVNVIRNTKQQGTGEDKDYRMQVLSTSSGCVAPGSIVQGSRVCFYVKPEGVFAADLREEVMLSADIWQHAPDTFGDFTYEMPLAIAAAAADTDTDYFRAAIMRSAYWLAFRSAGSTPDRQVCYDWSSDVDIAGIPGLLRGRLPYGWSLQLRRAVTVMAEGRRSDGLHLYGWNDGNIGSTGDGRIDEIETGNQDNGTDIAGDLILPWVKPEDANLSAQDIVIEHNSAAGSTGALVFHRGYSDVSYSMTPSTGSAVLIREVKMLTQQARGVIPACYIEWTQATGAPRRLRAVRLRAKVLPLYRQ